MSNLYQNKPRSALEYNINIYSFKIPNTIYTGIVVGLFIKCSLLRNNMYKE